MEETENKNVNNQEIVEPENNQTSETQPENTNTSKESRTDSKEYNWRQMEEKLKTEKSEKEQLQKRIWELEQKSLNNTATSKEQDELALLQEDDLITYSQLDRLAEKKARAIFQEEMKKAERAKQPLAAKQKYQDFEQVVTTENIEKLKQEDPDLEQMILASPNPYERTYKEIKRSEFYKSHVSNKENAEKFTKNSDKPVSSNSIGKHSPLSYANQFAKGDPSLWDEMQKYRGGSL